MSWPPLASRQIRAGADSKAKRRSDVVESSERIQPYEAGDSRGNVPCRAIDLGIEEEVGKESFRRTERIGEPSVTRRTRSLGCQPSELVKESSAITDPRLCATIQIVAVWRSGIAATKRSSSRWIVSRYKREPT